MMWLSNFASNAALIQQPSRCVSVLRTALLSGAPA